jgi:hypothetical protein
VAAIQASQIRELVLRDPLRLTYRPDTLAERLRIQQIRDRKEILGKQNTKAALIDPILIALGWDLQEIDEVRRE